MKILLVDIETFPNLAHVWGLWNQNVGITQIVTAGYTMCWSAKWFGDDQVMFDSLSQSSPKQMLKKIYKLIDQADVVIHYNGKKFDMPTLNKEFILHGMSPPSPYKQVDLLQVVRSQFKFPSNKLDYVARALGLGKKVEHKGHQLWVDCMAGDEAAWKAMQEYNIQDVILLEKLYRKLLPWIKGHPNRSEKDGSVCPVCGSSNYQKRGKIVGLTTKQRYQCKDCGKWFQDRIGKRDRSVPFIEAK